MGIRARTSIGGWVELTLSPSTIFDFKSVFVVQSVVAGRTGARMKTPIKSSSLRCKRGCPTCNGASKDSTYRRNQTTDGSGDDFHVWTT